MTDLQLLTDFACDGSDASFAELSHRHAGWIHAMAARLVRDRALADDVTQAVFLLLARKAGSLRTRSALSSWLFAATRYCASAAIRAELRRRKHERLAAMQKQTSIAENHPDWSEMAPLLDELVARLRHADRHAILLRFYEQKSFPQIGQQLAISEEAARKRVERAVDRLRGMFQRHGITLGAGALSATLSSNLAPSASAGTISLASAAATGAAGSTIAKSAGVMLTLAALKPVAAVMAAILLITTTGVLIAELPAQSTVTTAALQPAAPATRPGRPGRVLNLTDEPVSGARALFLSRETGNVSRILATTTTDSDGRFAFVGEDEAPDVLVLADGYALSAGSIAADPEDEPPVSYLAQPGSLQVKLLAPDGRPAAGVRVGTQMIRMGAGLFSRMTILPPEIQEQYSRVTDPNGVAVLERLPRNGTARIEILDDRFGQLTPGEFWTAIDQPRATIAKPIRLAPASTISGKVTYAHSGQSAVGVQVYGAAVDSSPLSSYGFAVTDEQGRYELKRLRAGEFNVSISLPDALAAQYTAFAREKLPLLEGASVTDVNLELIAGGVVRGTVTEQGTGRPVPGIYVGLYGPARPRSGAAVQSATTDANGAFSFRVPPGEQYVYIAGQPPNGLLMPEQKHRDVQLPDGQTVNVTFELPRDPSPPLAGTVVDENGIPQPRINVAVEFPNSDSPFGVSHFTRTDAEGRFRFVAVPRGSKLRAGSAAAESGDFAMRTGSAVAVVDAKNRDLTLVLKKMEPTSATIRIEDEPGEPIARAEVTLIEWRGEFGMGIEKRLTNAQGVATFKYLKPDRRYHIRATAEGYGEGGSGQLKLKPEAENTIPTIRIPKADSFIAGIVLDEAGQPLPDVRVSINGGKSGARSAYTNFSGHFRLENVVPGETATIFLQRNGQAGEPEQIQAGTADAVLIFSSKSTQ